MYKYSPKFHEGKANKMAFIETAQKEVYNTQDPRGFFNSGGEDQKLWDTLTRIRENINERIKERVMGFPHIEIKSLNTDKGTKYRILTTWKGGENYVTKYIRSLLEVDEALGFNATMVEITNPDGVKITSKQYTYEDINGIYVPKTVKMEQHDNKGETTLMSDITIETTGLNKPLPEDTFTIRNLGIEEDTLVNDKIKKAEFRFSKGELIPLSDPNKL
jgi:hypothetical protein